MNTLETSISSKISLLIAALLFLSWRPALLQSETLTMSTYYPAPYAGYDKLLTTGNTYLAKGDGAFVQWGSHSRLTADQGGSISLVASALSAKPYISFTSSVTGSPAYDVRLTVTRLCKDSSVSSCSYGDSEAVLSVNSDFMVGSSSGLDANNRGTLRRICTLTAYAVSRDSKHYCGGSLAASRKYTLLGVQRTTYKDGKITIPESGKMVCCKFETIGK
ncbi:MAG: hypothetical protein J5706_06705 [Elusimicrobiales bacterium]|nr:hypothetical protein [Elusimicrobiales bacterium]